jgi:hypothetical protein
MNAMSCCQDSRWGNQRAAASREAAIRLRLNKNGERPCPWLGQLAVDDPQRPQGLRLDAPPFEPVFGSPVLELSAGRLCRKTDRQKSAKCEGSDDAVLLDAGRIWCGIAARPRC